MGRRQHVLPAGPAGVVSQLRAYCEHLVAQRANIDAQLAAVDGALAALGGTARLITKRVTGWSRGAGPRPGSLRDCILRVLRAQRRPMRVMDITAAVRSAGYKSANKMLDKSVGNALGTMRQVVKVGRGEYRLRG
jgi:hypothetical protein